MKRNPLPFLISPHSEIDGKLNDEINVQAAREYARRRCNQTQTRNTMRHEHKRKNNSLPLKGNLNIFSSLNKKRITTPSVLQFCVNQIFVMIIQRGNFSMSK